MEIDNNKAVQLWHSGLGEFYKETIGKNKIKSFFTFGLEEDARERLHSYMKKDAMFLIIAAISITIGFLFFDEFAVTLSSGTSGFFLLIGLINAWQALRFFINTLRVNHNIKINANSDMTDSIRLKTIRKAIKWAVKEGHVQRNKLGEIQFKKKI